MENGPLCLRVVQECLEGDHGSLSLRAQGAAFASALAHRLPVRSSAPARQGSASPIAAVSAGASPGSSAGPEVDQDQDYAVKIATSLLAAALHVLKSAGTYTTMDGNLQDRQTMAATALVDRGAVRAGDLLRHCCDVVSALARRTPELLTSDTTIPLTLFSMLARPATAGHSTSVFIQY